MRLTALSLSTLLALATVTVAPRAFAQNVTDADRAAARDLFNKGVALQNQQKFADALDRFERSQKVVNAPTNLLHIGQCQAALGRLVEAAEAFRSAARFQLASNAPAPFVAAQNEANAQLSTIEPRIPELKIVVSPKDIPTLTVMVDDQPVNSALVGVSRPVNPGAHRVSASAPGYTKAERQVDLKEKQKLEVALTLVSTGGVVYGPTGGDTTGVTTPPPAGSSSAAVTTGTNPSSTMPPPPVDTRSKMSIFFGPRLGLMVPAGHLPNGSSATALGMDEVAGPGAALGIEGGLRVARILFFSLIGEASGYAGKSETITLQNSTYTSNVSSSSVMGGGKVGIISNPEGFGFFGSLGAGYRYFKATASADAQSGGTTTVEQSWQGIDYTLGLGMHFKAGKYVRLVPLAELTYGVFSSNDPNASGSSGGASDYFGSSSGSGPSVSSYTADHFFFFLGMGGYFDIDLDKPKPAAASPSTPAVTAPSAPPSADVAAPAAATP